MFDPKKPYDVCGKGNMMYWSQDGVIYNPSTKQPIDVASLTPPSKGQSMALKCNMCGAVRHSPESFREHLLVAHADKVNLPEKPEPPKEPEKVEPPKETGSAQLTTADVPGRFKATPETKAKTARRGKRK